MRYETQILRAMLRLSKKQAEASVDALLERVDGTDADVRVALRRMEHAGLVVRQPHDAARLTMAGLAVAVATVPPVRAAKQVRRKRAASRTRAA